VSQERSTNTKTTKTVAFKRDNIQISKNSNNNITIVNEKFV